MSLITIDQELCDKDGICAAECPMRIIDMKNGFPQLMEGAEPFCINCGHCVAVCPTAALSHKNLKPGDCMEINPEWALSPKQTEHFLRQRRSIRRYKTKPVEKEKLESIMALAAHAPSGHNLQPVHWHVLYNREEIVRLDEMVIDWMRFMIKEHPKNAKAMHLELVVAGWEAGLDTITRKAPHLILAHGRQKDPTSLPACTIALTWLDLALPSHDLGGCWCGFFNAAANLWPPLQEALGLPQGHVSHGAMMVGYPKFKYHRMPPRKAPRITWA